MARKPEEFSPHARLASAAAALKPDEINRVLKKFRCEVKQQLQALHACDPGKLEQAEARLTEHLTNRAIVMAGESLLERQAEGILFPKKTIGMKQRERMAMTAVSADGKRQIAQAVADRVRDEAKALGYELSGEDMQANVEAILIRVINSEIDRNASRTLMN